MAETKLTAAETDVLRMVLQTIVVRSRTGELGLEHGLDRFVGSTLMMRRPERDALEQVAKKVGLSGLRTRQD